MDINQRWENFITRPFDIKTVSPICFALEQVDGAFLTEEKHQQLVHACENATAIETKLMLMAVLSMFPLSFVNELTKKRIAAVEEKKAPVICEKKTDSVLKKRSFGIESESEEEDNDEEEKEDFMSIDEDENTDSESFSITSVKKISKKKMSEKIDVPTAVEKNDTLIGEKKVIEKEFSADNDIAYKEIIAATATMAAKELGAVNADDVFGKPVTEIEASEPEKIKKPRKKTEKRLLPEFKEKSFVPRFIRAFYAVIGSGIKNKIRFSQLSKAIDHAVINEVASPAERELWNMYNTIKWFDPAWKKDMGGLFPKRLCFIPVEITTEITVQMEPIPGKDTETKNGYKYLRVIEKVPALKKIKISGENADVSEATQDIFPEREEICFLSSQQIDDLADDKKKFIVRFFRAFYETQGIGIHTKEVLSSLAQKLDKKIKSCTANPQETRLWQLFVEKQWFNKEINKSVFFTFPRELKAYSVWVTPEIHVYFETLKKGDGDNRPFRYLRVI